MTADQRTYIRLMRDKLIRKGIRIGWSSWDHDLESGGPAVPLLTSIPATGRRIPEMPGLDDMERW